MICFGCMMVDKKESQPIVDTHRTNYDALLYAQGNRFITNAELWVPQKIKTNTDISQKKIFFHESILF